MNQLVLIKWADSKVMHGWRESEDTTYDDVAHCQTVGFLQYEDSEKVTITFGSSDSGFIMETITIPRGCIKSVRKLRVR